MIILKHKLRFIYLPYLLVAVSCVLGYSVVNWILIIETELLSLNDDLVNFWLPIALPMIPVLIWLSPRLKAIQAKNDYRNNYRDFLFITASLSIAAPTIVSQLYLETATGGITKLRHIDEILRHTKTKYYTVETAFPDKENRLIETKATRAGRHNEYLDVSVYIVCPLINHTKGVAAHAGIWLGKSYRKQLSGLASNNELNSQINYFLKTSLDEYENTDLLKFTYLERLRTSNDLRGFETPLKRSALFSERKTNVILVPHHDSFDSRNGDKLAWAFGSFGIGAFVWFLLLWPAPVDHDELKRLASGKKTTKQEATPFYDLLLPKPGTFITTILMDLNLLVFLGMVFAGMGVVSFASTDLLAVGGSSRSAIQHGEIWRLVSSMFIHGGLMHLLGNIYLLMFVGMLLEPLLRPMKFALCYLICGLVGSVVSVLWHESTVSVGASGAIFGLCGTLLSLALKRKGAFVIGRRSLINTVLFILGYNLIFGLLMHGIDHACHLGGLITGLIFGLVINILPSSDGTKAKPPADAISLSKRTHHTIPSTSQNG